MSTLVAALRFWLTLEPLPRMHVIPRRRRRFWG